MKRIVVLLVLSLNLLYVSADDACYDVYLGALKAYNAKNYIEAQRKFILVVESCGDYQEVHKKLKDCNAKIKEQQAAYLTEVSSLKTQNKSLLEQLSSLKSEHSELLRVSASKVATLDGQVTKTKEQLEKTNSNLASANSTIAKLRKDTALLHLQLDSLKNYADSLQKVIDKKQHRLNVPLKDNERSVQKQDSIGPAPMPIAIKEEESDTINIVKPKS